MHARLLLLVGAALRLSGGPFPHVRLDLKRRDCCHSTNRFAQATTTVFLWEMIYITRWCSVLNCEFRVVVFFFFSSVTCINPVVYSSCVIQSPLLTMSPPSQTTVNASGEWTLQKILLVLANLFCAGYICYLVFNTTKDSTWPGNTQHRLAEEEATPAPEVLNSGTPEETAATPAQAGPVSSAPRSSHPGQPASPNTASFTTSAKGPLSDQQMLAFKELTTSKRLFSSTFPSDERLSVTSDDMVQRRGTRLFDHLSCFGDDEQRSPRYDFAFIPIGCFGDAPGSACLTTSCYFGRSLANATFCGNKKFGAFLGDNFYPNGLKRDTDPRFERDLHNKFFRHGALRMRFYAMVGNHDKRPSTQIRRSGQHPFWYMPSFNYSGDLIRSRGSSVQVFVIDTHWGFDLNYPHMEAQAAWLDRELSDSPAKWKIVMSHEPVFCFEDFDHSRALMDFIHPVLKKHKVQLFVAAHVHGVFLHKVEGGYHQLTSAGFSDNVHTHVKAKRPRGYYHLGRGATAVFINETFADVVGFMPDGSIIFTHRIGVDVNPKVDVTDAAIGDTALFSSRHPCEALLPEVPSFCSKYVAGSSRRRDG